MSLATRVLRSHTALCIPRANSMSLSALPPPRCSRESPQGASFGTCLPLCPYAAYYAPCPPRGVRYCIQRSALCVAPVPLATPLIARSVYLSGRSPCPPLAFVCLARSVYLSRVCMSRLPVCLPCLSVPLALSTPRACVSLSTSRACVSLSISPLVCVCLSRRARVSVYLSRSCVLCLPARLRGYGLPLRAPGSLRG